MLDDCCVKESKDEGPDDPLLQKTPTSAEQQWYGNDILRGMYIRYRHTEMTYHMHVEKNTDRLKWHVPFGTEKKYWHTEMTYYMVCR